mmetsp:Transcript_16393/g.42903  ORF Transcript_16393/g.42903 Transcript_16393/m.42903 type:complete len:210 (-) Transcript_16393:63-692(-)
MVYRRSDMEWWHGRSKLCSQSPRIFRLGTASNQLAPVFVASVSSASISWASTSWVLASASSSAVASHPPESSSYDGVSTSEAASSSSAALTRGSVNCKLKSVLAAVLASSAAKLGNNEVRETGKDNLSVLGSTAASRRVLHAKRNVAASLCNAQKPSDSSTSRAVWIADRAVAGKSVKDRTGAAWPPCRPPLPLISPHAKCSAKMLTAG